MHEFQRDEERQEGVNWEGDIKERRGEERRGEERRGEERRGEERRGEERRGEERRGEERRGGTSNIIRYEFIGKRRTLILFIFRQTRVSRWSTHGQRMVNAWSTHGQHMLL